MSLEEEKKRPEWADKMCIEKYKMNERRQARKRSIRFYSKCEGMPLADGKVGFKYRRKDLNSLLCGY